MSIKLRTRQVYFRDQNGNYVSLPAFSAPSEGGGGSGGYNPPEAVTDEHINSLIDAKITPLESLADAILEVM